MYRQSEKNLLSSNTSCTCPHNMVNFSPLTAEIVSLVWGTPGNFNRFRVLAALLHGTLVLGVSTTSLCYVANKTRLSPRVMFSIYHLMTQVFWKCCIFILFRFKPVQTGEELNNSVQQRAPLSCNQCCSLIMRKVVLSSELFTATSERWKYVTN